MKKIVTLLSAVVLAVFCSTNLYSQEIGKGTSSVVNDLSASEFSGTVQMAMSNTDYMVTAGDIYTLTYAANGIPVSYTIPVDPTYKIRVSNLAVLDASGKSYITLKKQVEEIVQKNYPMSGVQFVLLNPASFKVVVNGEVKQTVERQAWALTRLSSVIAGTTTDYSSIRDVTVTSASGRKRTYDIFKATRDGDLSQNPYVRPGDVITLNRILRVVYIGGAVERPGSYELMKGENLKQLIEYYGKGLSDEADTSRITLTRSFESTAKAGDRIYLNKSAIDSDYVLKNGDSIIIASKKELTPYVIVEGIINNPNATADNATTSIDNTAPVNNSYRTSISFVEGENYANFVRRISGTFSTYSDLRNAYIERNGNKIPLNIEQILNDKAFVSPYFPVANDKLEIPFQQSFSTVLITGEVNTVREEQAWPLRRLSTVIEGNLTDYSSTRNVQVSSVDGVVSYYDLFQATRFGDLSQNPYIREGETVTIQRRGRKVTINGGVERPGTYELLEKDNLKKLVEYYGNGLTELADASRIILIRNREAEGRAGDEIYLTKNDIESDYALNNGDVITINTISDLKSKIIVEGIIKNPNPNAVNADNAEEADKTTMYRTSVSFYDGENYAALFRRIREMFSSYSDLVNAYVERDSKKIPMNIEEFIYDPATMSEYVVANNDKLVIPFMQHFQKILIQGEVTAVKEVEAWPLRRLSDIVSSVLTDYSSTRNIMVTSVDGITECYDLFKASRFGDLSQNPYVRAGETITIQRINRKVTISGSVERPGTYQLLDGQNLKDLITYYGNGLTEMADTSRIEVTRTLTDNEAYKSGEKLYLNQAAIDSNYELICYDTVFISSYRSLRPVMFIEGAINATEGTTLEAADRKAVQFEQGTNYAYLIRLYGEWFKSAASDTQNAFIIRGDKIIPINIDQMLYDASYYSDLVVEAYDTLRVPFKQYFVSVAGAVHNPGRYPYIPDRTYDYYVGLAGGFISEKNSFDAVTIVDINGKKMKKSDVITPETTITAESNSALYKFNQYSGVVTTTLSVLTTCLSAWAVIKANGKR